MDLALDEVGLVEDCDLDRLGRLSRRVDDVLDLGNHPDEVAVGHGGSHQLGHDPESSNLDLDLPVHDLVLESRNDDLSPLVRVLGPTDHLLASSEAAGLLVVCREEGEEGKESADERQARASRRLWRGTHR